VVTSLLRQSVQNLGLQMATKTRNPKFETLTQNSKERALVWFDRTFRAQSIYFYRLLGITIFLALFGLVMVLSASSIDSLKGTNNSFTVFNRQAAIAILGLFVMAAASLLPVSRFSSWAPRILVLALGVQFMTIFIGTDINGNRNWINILGLFSLQPSEFLKVALILHLANYLTKNENDLDIPKVWWQALIVPLGGMVLVMAGKDLGTVIVMFALTIGLLALAGLPARIAGAIALATAVLTPMLLSLGSGSRWGRILAWMNPSAADPNGYNWQSEHGIWAIAAGGIFGQGLGQSKMKWSWIPEVENDFIFAVIAEELGLIGALAVIGLFVFLMVALVKVYQRTADQFSRYVVLGVMAWIILQALINIAVVLRLLPVLGVPLPLISAGGSSILATLGAIGIVLAIERENHARPAVVRRSPARAKAKR
jgi:cell division protein FtsW